MPDSEASHRPGDAGRQDKNDTTRLQHKNTSSILPRGAGCVALAHEILPQWRSVPRDLRLGFALD